MNMKLLLSALIKFALGVLLTALLLFLPAGTFNYYEGWALMVLLFMPMFICGIILMFKNPQLLQKRLNTKESENTQSTIIKLSGLMFVAGFVLAGLNHRFGWTSFPTWFVKLGMIIFIIAYLLYGEVLRENTYLSRTIEVQANQKVIDTGLYGIVRHPMYSVTLLLFIAIPIILNSLPSLLVFLSYPFIINERIKNEEEVLIKGLPGYQAYTQKVKYRLIPFIY